MILSVISLPVASESLWVLIPKGSGKLSRFKFLFLSYKEEKKSMTFRMLLSKWSHLRENCLLQEVSNKSLSPMEVPNILKQQHQLKGKEGSIPSLHVSPSLQTHALIRLHRASSGRHLKCFSRIGSSQMTMETCP